MAIDVYQGFEMDVLVTPMGSESLPFSQGFSEFSENGPAPGPAQKRTIAIISDNLRHLNQAEIDQILGIIAQASERQYRAMAQAAAEAAQAAQEATEADR